MSLHEQLEQLLREVARLHIVIEQLKTEVRMRAHITIVNSPPVYVDPCPPRTPVTPWTPGPHTPCDEPYRVTCDSALPGADKCVRCDGTGDFSETVQRAMFGPATPID